MISLVLLTAIIFGKIQAKDPDGKKTWSVLVYTGTGETAGTIDQIRFQLWGPNNGSYTDTVLLDTADYSDQQRGAVDSYTFTMKDVGYPFQAKVWLEDSDWWYPTQIKLKLKGSDQWLVFPINRWIRPDDRDFFGDEDPCYDPDGYKVINEPRVLPRPWDKCISKTCHGCDPRLQHRWYRFQVHGEDVPMPTQCQGLNKCSPYAPLWMRLKGELPTVGKEMVAEAFASSKKHCFAWSIPITVRNCGEFYLYKLKDVPTCFLRYCTEVNIVSPNPISKDWPMEVKCSVATIGGLQKLKGIDDSYLIYKLWLSRQKGGKWLRVAELDTLTGEFETSRHNLPPGVRNMEYHPPEGNKNKNYQNVLSAHITMQVGNANYLDHVTNYSCEIEYGYGTERLTMVFKQTPSFTNRQPKTTPEPTLRPIVTPAHPLPFYEDLRYQIVMFIVLVLFLGGGVCIGCRMLFTPGPSSEKLSFETRSSEDSRDFSELSSTYSRRFYETKGRAKNSSKKSGRTSKNATKSSKGKTGRGKKQSSKRSGRSSSRRSGSSKYTEDNDYYY